MFFRLLSNLTLRHIYETIFLCWTRTKWQPITECSHPTKSLNSGSVHFKKTAGGSFRSQTTLLVLHRWLHSSDYPDELKYGNNNLSDFCMSLLSLTECTSANFWIWVGEHCVLLILTTNSELSLEALRAGHVCDWLQNKSSSISTSWSSTNIIMLFQLKGSPLIIFYTNGNACFNWKEFRTIFYFHDDVAWVTSQSQSWVRDRRKTTQKCSKVLNS